MSMPLAKFHPTPAARARLGLHEAAYTDHSAQRDVELCKQAERESSALANEHPSARLVGADHVRGYEPAAPPREKNTPMRNLLGPTISGGRP